MSQLPFPEHLNRNEEKPRFSLFYVETDVSPAEAFLIGLGITIFAFKKEIKNGFKWLFGGGNQDVEAEDNTDDEEVRNVDIEIVEEDRQVRFRVRGRPVANGGLDATIEALKLGLSEYEAVRDRRHG